MSRPQVTNAELASRDSVERELDERHAAAQDAFAKRDLEAYRAMFSGSLRYRRADGEVIELSSSDARRCRSVPSFQLRTIVICSGTADHHRQRGD